MDRQSEPNLHRTTTIFYRPDLYFSSNEDNDHRQKEAKESLINYAPIEAEADRQKSLLGDGYKL